MTRRSGRRLKKPFQISNSLIYRAYSQDLGLLIERRMRVFERPRVVNLQRRLGTIMAKTICKILGVVFLLVGIAGFAAPHLLGAHLTPAHNLVHLASGAIALYLGFAGSMSAARTFCLIFGIVYLALGFLGQFVFGDPAMDRMWHVGPLDLAKVDHFIHILLGVVFLAGGLLSKKP
jgi:hypothetical protein